MSANTSFDTISNQGHFPSCQRGIPRRYLAFAPALDLLLHLEKLPPSINRRATKPDMSRGNTLSGQHMSTSRKRSSLSGAECVLLPDLRLQLQLKNISGRQLVVAEERESKMRFSFFLLIGTVTCQLQEGLPNPTVPTKHPVTTEIVILKEQNKRVEKVFVVNEDLNKDLTFQWQVDVNSNSTETVRVILQHGNDTKSFDLPYARTLNRDKKLEKAPLSGRSIVLCPKEMVNKDSILVVTLISSSNSPIEVIIEAILGYGMFFSSWVW